MTFTLHSATTDDFNDVGEGKRVNHEIWYRSDLKEIRAMLDGEVVILFKKDGRPGRPNKLADAPDATDFQRKPDGGSAYSTKLAQLRTEIVNSQDVASLKTSLTHILDYLARA